MSSEYVPNPIMLALRSARMANEAALHAIRAAEQLLTMIEDEPVLESPEPVQEVVQEVVPVGCTHENAMLVSTMSGSYKVCECGEQIEE